MSMNKLCCLGVYLILASCAAPNGELLVANTSNIKDPRRLLQEQFAEGESPKLVYFDRSHNMVYSLGKRFEGLKFTSVDVSELENSHPNLVRIVRCATGVNCSNSMFETCKASFRLAEALSDADKNLIATTMRARGYPVVQVTFHDFSDSSQGIEIRYFDECELVTRDFQENFPALSIQ